MVCDLVSVKDFGAVGDGVADDTTEIQAAIDALPAGGGTVFFPAGTYLISTALAPSDGCRLLGVDTGSVIKVADSADVHAIRINAVNDVTVEFLEIDGNKVNQTTGGHGVTSVGTSVKRIRISDCYIHDCKFDGIGLAATTSVNVIVERCIVNDNDGSGINNRSGTIVESVFANNIAKDNGEHNIGITSKATYLVISDNVCDGAGTADNITGYNTGNRHISVTGNVCKVGANHGIHLGGRFISIVGNVINAPTNNGIMVANTNDSDQAYHAVVADNIINAAGDNGIYLGFVSRFTISGNVIDAATNQGINSIYCSLGAITGNSIRASGGRGMRLSALQDSVVSGNEISASQTQGITLQEGDIFSQGTRQSEDNSISINRCFNNGLAASADVIEELSTSDFNHVFGNHVRGNGSNTITLVGAGSSAASNFT